MRWERFLPRTLLLVAVHVHGHRSWASDSSHEISVVSLELRGGVSGFTDNASTHDADSSVVAVSSAAARLVLSAFLVAQEVTTTHVLPTLRDPYDRLWLPTRRFLRSQNEAAMERQGARSAMASTPLSPNRSSDAPQEITFRSTYVGTAPKTIPVSSTDSLDSSSLRILLLPKRVFKLSLVAWALAEILDHLGILNEHTPAVLRSQMHRVWYDDIQPQVSILRARIQSVWRQRAPDGIQSLPSKYQFATGAMLGMLASPMWIRAVTVAWQPAAVVYALSELHVRLKRAGHWKGLGGLFGESGQVLDRGLERIQESVHEALPSSAINDDPMLLLLPPPTKRSIGVSSSLLATSGGSKVPYSLGVTSYGHRTHSALLSAKKEPSHLRIRDTAGMSDSMNDDTTFVEMVRHGFLVGGVLGLIAGM